MVLRSSLVNLSAVILPLGFSKGFVSLVTLSQLSVELLAVSKPISAWPQPRRQQRVHEVGEIGFVAAPLQPFVGRAGDAFLLQENLLWPPPDGAPLSTDQGLLRREEHCGVCSDGCRTGASAAAYFPGLSAIDELLSNAFIDYPPSLRRSSTVLEIHIALKASLIS